MGMTMTQKILAAHCQLETVSVGDFIEVKIDLALGNDITAPVSIDILKKCNLTSVFDKSKIALVPDHFVPNKDINSAQQCKKIREYAQVHDIDNYFDVGEMGIEHVLLPEKGLVKAGDVIIGADSHTCTYGVLGAFSTGVGSTDLAASMVTGKAWIKVPDAIKFVLKGKLSRYVSGKDLILHIIGMIGVSGALYQSMEFTGEGVKSLSMSDRFTVTNMAIEAGAKNGIFPVDEITKEFLDKHTDGEYTIYEADEDANYSRVIEIDLSQIKSIVAFPHSPENTKTIDKINALDDIKVDQVIIGSCTNGRLSDLREAAEILRGKKVAKGVRLIVFPGTQKIHLEAIKEGLVEVFIEAGGVFSTSTCGPCLGGHMGILAEGETAISTTNRNFVGRMGHVNSGIYLSSPAVAAASALAGKICGPE